MKLKSNRFLARTIPPTLALVSFTAIHAADIDTTDGVTLAPEAGNKYIGSGTLTVDGVGTVNLASAEASQTTEFAMAGGTIEIVSGTELVNGGWQKGIWASNLAGMQVNGTFDLWDGNPVIIDALTGSGTVTKKHWTNEFSDTRTLTVGQNNGSGTFTGIITQDGIHITALAKNGSGTQILTGENNYSGATTINGGTLQIGEDGTSGTLGTGPVTIGSGATLFINRSDDYSIPATQSISGAGSFTKSGAGTLTLTGANSYAGGTTVNGGSLVFQDSAAGGDNYTANTSATLEFKVTTAGNNIQLDGGSITGGGTLVKSGAGQLWLGANGSAQGVSMASGGLIDVQAGLIRNEYGSSGWGNNKADMNIATGAYVDLWDGNITVNALTGSGTINKAWSATNTLTVGSDNGSGTFSGTISNLSDAGGGYSGAGTGTLNLTKVGSGTQTLSGANSYSGTTTVSEGTLIISGNISTSSLTTVKSGATLGGPGTVGALKVESDAILTPGNSPGILNTGNLDHAGTLSLDLNGTTAGNDYDQVKVTGSVTLSGLLAATVSGGYTPQTDQLLFILLNDGSDEISGTFSGMAQDSTITFSGFNWKISYTANGDSSGSPSFTGGNDVALKAIPEPGVAVLGAFGVLALLRRRRI